MSEVREMLAEASKLPYGPGRLAVTEEAVRVADRNHDDEASYDARIELLQAAIFGGYPEKALVAFGWLVAKSDEDPERFPESAALGGLFVTGVDVLWGYKWIVQHTGGFPQISREQIEQTLDDMEARYRKHGLSLRPVWMNRARASMQLDDDPGAVDDYFERWQETSRGPYADCAACEQNFRVEVHLHRERYPDARRAAEPLLNGEMSCAEVPHITYCEMLLPTFEAGRVEDAARFHERGYELVRDNRDLIGELAWMLDYRLVTGDLEGAVELADRHLPWVADSRVGRRRWRWFVSMSQLLDRVCEREAVPFRLPEGLGPAEEAARRDPVALRDWFVAAADELTRAFDQRNGNDVVSRQREALLARLRD